MLEALATTFTVRTMAVADKIPFLLAQAPPGGGTPSPVGGAANGTGGAATGTGNTGTPPGGLGNYFPILILGFLLFMVIQMVLTGKREKRARAELMASLAKHDKVQTAGGMIGTIVEVKGDEVVLKVDESTNTKIRFTRSSVTSILKKGRGGDTPAETETLDSVK